MLVYLSCQILGFIVALLVYLSSQFLGSMLPLLSVPRFHCCNAGLSLVSESLGPIVAMQVYL